MAQAILGNPKLKFIKGMFYAAPPPPPTEKYLCIEALEDGLQIKLSTNACQYSLDKEIWYNLSKVTYTPSINTGERIYFKGNLTPTSLVGIGTFTISKKCNVLGNCNSMLFGDDAESNLDLTGYNYAFYKLFSYCPNIIDASQLILPATTLAEGCYNEMFVGCASLVTAPELPATTLANKCYNNMFEDCTKLNYIKALFTTTPSSSYTSDWVSGVSRTGTFIKNKNATWNVTGENGIPSGWTVQTA